MDFEKNYKNLTDDKIISLLNQSETLKPEAVIALKKEVLARPSLSNDLIDTVAHQKVGKYEEMVKRNKSYFIMFKVKALVFFLFNIIVLLLVNYFVYHLYIAQIIVYAILLTIVFVIIFRNTSPIITVKKETIEISNYNKLFFSKTFLEFSLFEKLINVFIISTRLSKTTEIQYSDIIAINMEANEIIYFSDIMDLKEVLDGVNDLFINHNFKGKETQKKEIVTKILFDCMDNKQELIKILEIKKIQMN